MHFNHSGILHIRKPTIQPLFLEELITKQVGADVLRLDEVHQVVSGNKWFKLKYYLEEALQNRAKALLTFGGAWSNHIIATAYVAREAGLHSIGIVRGEEPRQLSHTLLGARELGMQLKFIRRMSYAVKDLNGYINEPIGNPGDVYVIPEGGAGLPGIQGSKDILALTARSKYSHIMCCIGSGTMFMGLANSSLPTQEIIGIPVLKGFQNLPQAFDVLFEDPLKRHHCKIITDYHFGGYAKKNASLFRFMNTFYQQTGIPTDFVYTGKLLFAFMDLIRKDYFPPGSNALIIHSGGLQGNASLPAETLTF